MDKDFHMIEEEDAKMNFCLSSIQTHFGYRCTC